MRKSPTIQLKLCSMCGKTYAPTGNSQRYCRDCGKIRVKESKLRYYRQKFPNAKPKSKSSEVCCVCGGALSSHFEGKPYCNTHYLRMKNNGTPWLVGRKSKNKFSVFNDFVVCETTSGIEFLISLCDLEATKKYTWCLSKTGYLVANAGGKVVKLHRYLLSPDDGFVVDHINGNPKDNRRENLRVCTAKENIRNSKKKGEKTIIAGVEPIGEHKYRARITVDGKEHALGIFRTAEEAVSARKEAESMYFGDYSPIASRKTSTLGTKE